MFRFLLLRSGKKAAGLLWLLRKSFFLAVPQDSPYGNETEISLNMVREEAFLLP